ncbi:MAG: rod shape-determining protein MreC [Bacteroidetes bacterium SW_9_63_38]|nr:MAG: rod shape-determining protein MreC [Bacteroidetes bacterium SW_9_63_38]
MVSQNHALSRALRAQTMEVTAEVESSFAWMGRYLRVLRENEELRRRNIELSSRVARTRSVRMENRELRQLLQLRDSTDHRLVAARIVTKDIFQQENFLTLDVGRKDGIREGMPVVHQSGIVGTVMLTSEEYSRVMPLLNTDFRVPGTIVPLQTDGIVRWDGERQDRLLLEHVVKTEPVEPGQSVVTSGHSDVFPPGRSIGTVDSVQVRPGRSELLIYLRPAVSLHEIDHAFVLLRTPAPNRQQVESRSIG